MTRRSGRHTWAKSRKRRPSHPVALQSKMPGIRFSSDAGHFHARKDRVQAGWGTTRFLPIRKAMNAAIKPVMPEITKAIR